MIGIPTTLIHDVAVQRSHEIRATAEQERLVRETSRENGIPTTIERIRGLIGNALVGTGNLLGGRRTERQVGPGRFTDAAVLRIAR